MGQQLSRNDLEFLRRLARLPEGQLLLDLLQRNLAETDVRLRNAIGEDLLRTQGRAQLLAELVDQVSKAEEKLERAPARRIVANPTEWAG